jgi:hypothetical protein
MMTDRELNLMIDNFLLDTSAKENDAFVQKVMSELPQAPRWAWVQDVFIASAICCVMITLWKFHVLTPHVFLSGLSQALLYVQGQLDMLSPMNTMALGAGIVVFICYNAYETFVEI